MLTERPDALRARAAELAAAMPSAAGAVVVAGESEVGGGSFPGAKLPTSLVRLNNEQRTADGVVARLRGGSPPVIARIVDDHVVLDPRTIAPQQLSAVAAAVAAAIG
jgi:L-seryl-tRNA(Ser) seleniumtransferase